MNIINFRQDLEEKVIQLWNQTLTADIIDINRFRQRIIYDDNFDTELACVAMDNEEVIGFILGTKRKIPYLDRGLEPTKGWINLIFVRKDYEGKGIGEKLVNKVEEKLKDMGATNIILGAYSPNYFFPGIDIGNYPRAVEFFERLGYVGGEESYSMSKDLHGYFMKEDIIKRKKEAEKAGFIFRRYKNSDALELLEFARVNFGGGWKRNALLSMQGGEAEECIVLVLDKNQEIVGFAMRKIDGNPMRFGPIGVKEDVRNYGIGGILFEYMQEEMASKGIYHLYFQSTDVPGRRFYERHGVKVFRTYRNYDKSLMEE